MIPLHLTISGFLSYCEQAELDFSGIELACIAGANGAGKSSLLDAITWSLFGQARKRDDSLINARSDAAEVSLVFEYEGNIYRVQRTKPRDKVTSLELQILQSTDYQAGPWKALTERTLRGTEARIQSILRLDYETFVNAAFFLQGKADQFTQQRPGDRKRILGNILGLEIWEVYRQRAAERRRGVEGEVAAVDGRLHEIESELKEEQQRKERLAQLEADLERLGQDRAAQESALENIRAIAANLANQSKTVATFKDQLQSAERKLETFTSRAAARKRERDEYAGIISKMDEIQAAYTAWQQARQDLERWEEVASRFREQESRRNGPRTEIQAERARLEQELRSLEEQQRQAQAAAREGEKLQAQVESEQTALAEVEQRLAQRSELDAEMRQAQQRQAEAGAENPRLRAEMEEIKERMTDLERVEGANCPLCGQPLSAEERQKLIENLQQQGTEMADRFRANRALMRETDDRVKALQAQLKELDKAQAELRAHSQRLAQLKERLGQQAGLQEEWEQHGQPRQVEIRQALAQESFAPEARQVLAQIDAELKSIGYDAAAHDAARRAEQQGRASEEQVRSLERAQAALAPLERELSDLQAQITESQAEVTKYQQLFTDAAATLAEMQSQAPDLRSAERQLYQLQERENQLRIEVGAARQKVLVLSDQKQRRKQLRARRDELANQIKQYRQLERAFGKDGVPALLIEQALPQIETKANEILDRLSGGNMSVRFVTQAAYKDKRRDDLRETLEIQISDSAGLRDYEMFSGGEAFRVNFAIRLALSEVLSQRAGARLQTLVIDEGFGSQDELGRQRLVEAINMVRSDFARVLVITHIDELKEAFPNRIEVEKTARGSRLCVT